MMSQERLIKALQEEALKCQATGQRYSGALALYQAACMENNGTVAEEHRQQLHVLLDMLLDSMATQQMLQRQILTFRG